MNEGAEKRKTLVVQAKQMKTEHVHSFAQSWSAHCMPGSAQENKAILALWRIWLSGGKKAADE